LKKKSQKGQNKMKLWLLSQTENTGYDTFDSCVVAAETEDEAKKIHPAEGLHKTWYYNEWATSPDSVLAKLIGEAIPETKCGVILTSYNAR
jgi:hypothetical protein